MTERKNTISEGVIDTTAAPGEIPETKILEALVEMVGHDLGVPENVLSGEVIPDLPDTTPNIAPVLPPQNPAGPLKPNSAA